MRLVDAQPRPALESPQRVLRVLVESGARRLDGVAPERLQARLNGVYAFVEVLDLPLRVRQRRRALRPGQELFELVPRAGLEGVGLVVDLVSGVVASLRDPRRFLFELADPAPRGGDHRVAAEAADGVPQRLEIGAEIAHLIPFGGAFLGLEVPQRGVDRRDRLRAGGPGAQRLESAVAARFDEVVDVGGLLPARRLGLFRLFGVGKLPLLLLGRVLQRGDRLVRLGEARGIREKMLERLQLRDAAGGPGVIPGDLLVEIGRSGARLQRAEAAFRFRRVRRVRIAGSESLERGGVRTRFQIGPRLLAPLRLGLRLDGGDLLVDLGSVRRVRKGVAKQRERGDVGSVLDLVPGFLAPLGHDLLLRLDELAPGLRREWQIRITVEEILQRRRVEGILQPAPLRQFPLRVGGLALKIGDLVARLGGVGGIRKGRAERLHRGEVGRGLQPLPRGVGALELVDRPFQRRDLPIRLPGVRGIGIGAAERFEGVEIVSRLGALPRLGLARRIVGLLLQGRDFPVGFRRMRRRRKFCRNAWSAA